MSRFKREERYLVVKLKDLQVAAPGENSGGQRIREWLQRDMRGFANHYAEFRKNVLRKPDLECVVVEKDWPEYEVVWALIEARMTGNPNRLIALDDDFTRMLGDIAQAVDVISSGVLELTADEKAQAKELVDRLYNWAQKLPDEPVTEEAATA